MSLEIGKKIGFFSSLVFVIVPPVTIALLLTFISSIISSIQLGNLNDSNLPSGLGGLALFGAGLGITLVALAILSLIALILLIIAMHYLSKYYNTPGIFKNIFYAVIINIVSIVVVFALNFALIAPAARNISISGTTPTIGNLGGVVTGLIAVVVVAVVMSIISAVLVWRSFNLLGEKSEVDSFKTAGLLYLIGVLLSIIFIGAIIAWIAFIFASLGFSRLKPLPPTATPMTYPPQSPPLTTIIQTKRCPYCQTENRIDVTYCRFCGKSLT